MTGELFMGGSSRTRLVASEPGEAQDSVPKVTQEQDATVAGTCFYVVPSSPSSLKELGRTSAVDRKQMRQK